MDAAENGYAGRGKKEVLMLTRERQKLERVLGGIADMTKAPSALWVVDTNKEHIAVNEAEKLRIPVVAVLDTNCDPDDVNFPIPGNDDAIGAVKILTHIIGEAVIAGKQQREERQLASAREAAGDTDAKHHAEVAEAAAQAAASAEVSAADAAKAAAEAEAAAPQEVAPVEQPHAVRAAEQAQQAK